MHGRGLVSFALGLDIFWETYFEKEIISKDKDYDSKPLP